jgi:hypothetical protein
MYGTRQLAEQGGTLKKEIFSIDLPLSEVEEIEKDGVPEDHTGLLARVAEMVAGLNWGNGQAPDLVIVKFLVRKEAKENPESCEDIMVRLTKDGKRHRRNLTFYLEFLVEIIRKTLDELVPDWSGNVLPNWRKPALITA